MPGPSGPRWPRRTTSPPSETGPRTPRRRRTATRGRPRAGRPPTAARGGGGRPGRPSPRRSSAAGGRGTSTTRKTRPATRRARAGIGAPPRRSRGLRASRGFWSWRYSSTQKDPLTAGTKSPNASRPRVRWVRRGRSRPRPVSPRLARGRLSAPARAASRLPAGCLGRAALTGQPGEPFPGKTAHVDHKFHPPLPCQALRHSLCAGCSLSDARGGRPVPWSP